MNDAAFARFADLTLGGHARGEVTVEVPFGRAFEFLNRS